MVRHFWMAVALVWGNIGWAKANSTFAEYFRDPTPQWSVTPGVSPDGRWMVYGKHVRSEKSIVQPRYQPSGMPSGEVGVQIELINVRTKEVIPVCGSSKEICARPSWSPKGGKLAYYSDKSGKTQVWVYDLSLRKSKPMFSAPVKLSLWPGDEPIWSPDGKQVLVPIPEKKPEEVTRKRLASTVSDVDTEKPIVLESEASSGAEVEPVVPMNSFYRSEHLAGLSSVNINSGKARTIISPQTNPAPARFRLSATGGWISYLSVLRNIEPSNPRAVMDLVVVSRDGKTVLIVAQDLPRPNWEYFDHLYRWHPKDDYLVFLKEGKLWKFDPRTPGAKAVHLATSLSDLTTKPLLYSADGTAIYVGGSPNKPIGYNDPSPSMIYRVPLAENASIRYLPLMPSENLKMILPFSERQAWSAGSLEMAILVEDGKTEQNLIVGFERETLQRKDLMGGRTRLSAPALGSSDRFITQYEDVETPREFFLFSNDFSKKERLTTISPSYQKVSVALEPPLVIRTEVPVGKSEEVAKAVVLIPKEKKSEKWPAVFMGYPGSDESSQAVLFGGGDVIDSNPSIFYLARGYAVVLVDLPMVPNGERSNPVQDLTAVLLPQVDKVLASAPIDPKRIAFIGQSYGGYMAASILTQTNRFKAAIAVSGIFDLPMFYTRFDLRNGGVASGLSWTEGGQGRMGGNLWKELPRYLDNSPFYQAHKIETPLLMLHGTIDMGFEQAKGMFVALRRLGRRGTLVAYPNEDHSIHQWSVAHAVHANEQIFQFLDRELACTSCSH